MSNYIQYDSPEWKRISQCLVKIGIYGTDKCRKEEGAYVVYKRSRVPAITRRNSDSWVVRNDSSIKAYEAVALLNEKYPEYKWEVYLASVIQGVLR